MRDKKTVLITGGNKGIGLDTSKLFVEAGYAVVVLARDFKNFPLQGNPAVQSVEYDLADIEGIPQLMTSLPPIDVLVNNAGIMYMKAPVALITEVSKNMVAKGAGRIVNNASIAGEIGHPDIWYGITKAGMINITKSFAKILGPQGVVVNAVAPGPAETEMLATIPEPRKKAIKSAVYTGRFAYPQEVARAMFWLATDCPEYINGTCIDINNGAFPR